MHRIFKETANSMTHDCYICDKTKNQKRDKLELSELNLKFSCKTQHHNIVLLMFWRRFLRMFLTHSKSSETVHKLIIS